MISNSSSSEGQGDDSVELLELLQLTTDLLAVDSEVLGNDGGMGFLYAIVLVVLDCFLLILAVSISDPELDKLAA